MFIINYKFIKMNEAIKSYDNGVKQFDVTETSLQVNPWLKNYGMDRYTYKPEMTFTSASYYKQYEGSISHGYPSTSWLQLALVYACGLYTAKE